MAMSEKVRIDHKIILINKREAAGLINSLVCQIAKLSNSGDYSTHNPTITVEDSKEFCRYTFSVELPDRV